MADVSKVHGPVGPPDPSGKKDKASVDADKFKDAMRKRVEEVSKIDPDEKKKRRQREEGVEEEAVGPPTGPTTPADQVAPFSMEKGVQKASHLDAQKGTPPPMKSAQPSPKSGFLRPHVSEEMSDDSGLLEEESFEETLPPAQGPIQQRPSYPGQSQVPSGGWTPEGQQPVAPGPPESGQRRDAQHTAREKTPKTHEAAKPSKKEDTSAFFEQMSKGAQKGKKEEKKPAEEAEAPIQGVGAPPQQILPDQPPKKSTEKKIEQPSQGGAAMPHMETPGAGVLPAPPPGPEGLSPYANLHPQVQELFDRMVGVMTVMNMSGMSETVITLNSPQFASSVFFGTQIIIQEFSTAPQTFNIQLNGTPQAVALFQNSADDLMAAFQSGNYNFRVNRLETGYLTDRPLFRRKGKAEGDKQQTGDGPP